MPRETIFTPYPHDPTTGPAPFQMVVGWQRDCDVQVGIETPNAGDGHKHLIDYLYGDESTLVTIAGALDDNLREYGLTLAIFDSGSRLYPIDHPDSDSEARFKEVVGRAVLDAVTASSPFGDSVWWHPGRKQINDLIRLLRRARDAAFGRDE